MALPCLKNFLDYAPGRDRRVQIKTEKIKSPTYFYIYYFIISSDWGHAKDFVEAMWHMLQLEKPEDFVIATGHMHSVREFVEKSFAFIGKEIVWEGKGKFA